MNTREVREILAVHANDLIARDTQAPTRISRNDQVQGLLDLAEHLHGILVPVQPGSDFRRRLHGDLILRAQSQQARERASLLQQHRTGILIGAAAVGSVASVVGVVVAFVLRHRHGRATHIASG